MTVTVTRPWVRSGSASGVGSAAMAAAAGWGWVAPAVTAAALATSAAVVALKACWLALTACWLALCRLAAWRRRRTRVAGDFPDPPKGSRAPRPTELAKVKKGGHGGTRPGAGMPRGTSQLQAQRGLAKQEEPKSK